MEKIADIRNVQFQKKQGGQFRWITISTVLLALGAILHIVAPSVGGITPNFLIATYCTAILLVKPKFTQAIGIGLVAGLIEMMTSKSGFPYGNLASEFVGATIVYMFSLYIGRLAFGKRSILAIVVGFIATLFSGITFVVILMAVLHLPTQVALYVIMPVVLTVAAVNAALTGLLYGPAVYFLRTKGFIK